MALTEQTVVTEITVYPELKTIHAVFERRIMDGETVISRIPDRRVYDIKRKALLKEHLGPKATSFIAEVGWE